MLQLCVCVYSMCIVLCTAQKSDTDHDTCTLNGGSMLHVQQTTRTHARAHSMQQLTPTCIHTDHRCIWCLCINDHNLRMSHVQSANTKLYNM